MKDRQKMTVKRLMLRGRFKTTPVLLAMVFIALSLAFATPAIGAQRGCDATVTVARGDTLFGIAMRCNTTMAALLEANPEIDNRSRIYAGQVLSLPGNEAQPEAPSVDIEPTSGPPNSVLNVAAAGFPSNTEVIVGLGRPESEADIQFRHTTNASGRLDTALEVPGDTQLDQRLVVTVYVPAANGVRATSPAFRTIDRQQEPTATISPTEGPPGTPVQLQSGDYDPNLPVEIGFGRVASEYDLIAQAQASSNGDIRRIVQVPRFAEPGDEYVFVVVPSDTRAEVISNVFTVTGNGPATDAQVEISPRSGPPGSNVQVALSGFPGNRRVSYGIGEPRGQLLRVFSVRTNAAGAAQATLSAPTVYEAGTALTVTAYVPQQGGPSASSEQFTVTRQNGDGENLFTQTNIYLIALEDAGQTGMEIGCGDSIVPVEVEIEPTIAPLTAALETLFDIDERFYGQSGLYNALYRADLTMERIDITDGIAEIRLTGDLAVGGVCDGPRIRAQLEETALQYNTVDEARFILNGESLESLLSGRGPATRETTN